MICTESTTESDGERLWELVGHIERWPPLLPTVTSVKPLTDGDACAVGSRFEVRQPGLAKAEWEVTKWEPGRGFTWASRSLAVVTTATHEITANGSGSRLTLTLDWSGPLAPLVRRVYGRRVRAMVELEAATFARLAQSP